MNKIVCIGVPLSPFEHIKLTIGRAYDVFDDEGTKNDIFKKTFIDDSDYYRSYNKESKLFTDYFMPLDQWRSSKIDQIFDEKEFT